MSSHKKSTFCAFLNHLRNKYVFGKVLFLMNCYFQKLSIWVQTESFQICTMLDTFWKDRLYARQTLPSECFLWAGLHRLLDSKSFLSATWADDGDVYVMILLRSTFDWLRDDCDTSTVSPEINFKKKKKTELLLTIIEDIQWSKSTKTLRNICTKSDLSFDTHDVSNFAVICAHWCVCSPDPEFDKLGTGVFHKNFIIIFIFEF